MKKVFSWTNFELKFLKSIIRSELTPQDCRPRFVGDQKEMLIPFMDRIAKEPYKFFVETYKSEIIENFLKDSEYLRAVIRELESNHYSNAKVGAMEDMLELIRRFDFRVDRVNMAVRRQLLHAGRNYSDDMEDEETSLFSTPVTIDLLESTPSEVPLYDFQREATDALEKHFVENNENAGILVMPTGSGKTRVATRFMIESMVARGWQVLWLAHRSMLIEQAANATYQFAGGLLPSVAPHKKQFKFVCVSGKHATMKYVEAKDDVIIGTVQSIIASDNLEYLRNGLQDNVFIVVDEAHHTSAPSYRKVIDAVKAKAKRVKLMGLTATPIRMGMGETARLMKIFDNNIIYSVAMSKLIASGQLSRPNYISVDTEIDFETKIGLDEKKYIQKWGELAPKTLQRMADIKERNALIVDTFMKDREKYGKTLMFALNGVHCMALCDELRKRGVSCDYIYSLHQGNAEKINKFLRGDIDVLVNIQVLTEGSDIPDIQTVFLTRPTSSDTLLMQMIGRGMRGVQCGGTETVNVVDFHDVWGKFNQWLNPQFLLKEEAAEDAEVVVHEYQKPNLVPWQMYKDILDDIHTKYANANEGLLNLILPTGWYDVIDEDGNDAKILVFDSQVEEYAYLIKHLSSLPLKYTGNEALYEYFDGFGLLPEAHDLQMLLYTYRIDQKQPVFHKFEEREEIDASVVAKRLIDEKITVAGVDKFIKEIYDANPEIIKSIYGGLSAYSEKVKLFALYPNGEKPLGMRIEEIPPEILPYDATPYYDLQQLVNEVVAERFDNAYGEVPEVLWTQKRYTSFYGQYNYAVDGQKPFIRINSILNSKDIPREVVKYVIYHELLHRDNHAHNRAFRMEEHKYPDWAFHDQFLDVTFNQFDIVRDYAM